MASPLQGTGGPTVVNINSGAGGSQSPFFGAPPNVPDTFHSSQKQTQKPQTVLGKVKAFVGGFASAAMGLFSVKGLLMAGVGILVGTLFPFTIPLMIAGTTLLSGLGMAKALKNGDYKAAGQNAFGVLGGILGARGSAGGAASEGMLSRAFSNFKTDGVVGLAKMARTEFQQGLTGFKNIGKQLTGQQKVELPVKSSAPERFSLKEGSYIENFTDKQVREAHLETAKINWETLKKNPLDTAKDTALKLFGFRGTDVPITNIQTVAGVEHKKQDERRV